MNKPSTYVLLPTKSNSHIYQSKVSLDKSFKVSLSKEPSTDYTINYFLYILSDEKCKHGEYKYCSFTEKVTKYDQFSEVPGTGWCEHCIKIIATTNPELLEKWTSTPYGTRKVEDGAIQISPPDIEYIISLYNDSRAIERLNEVWGDDKDGKYQQHYIEKLALDSLKPNWEHLYINGSYPSKPYPTLFQKEVDGWCNGYNKCLQDNADKIYTHEDVLEFYKYVKTHTVKEAFQHLESLTKEQPRRDTVTVVYKKGIGNEIYTPVIQDGYIVIVR